MPRYKVEQKYGSGLHGPWEPGDTVEVSEEEAEWINRDCDGTLTLAGQQEREATVEEQAAERRAKADAARGRDKPPAEPAAEKPKKAAPAKRGATKDDASEAHSTENAPGLTR